MVSEKEQTQRIIKNTLSWMLFEFDIPTYRIFKISYNKTKNLITVWHNNNQQFDLVDDLEYHRLEHELKLQIKGVKVEFQEFMQYDETCEMATKCFELYSKELGIDYMDTVFNMGFIDDTMTIYTKSPGIFIGKAGHLVDKISASLNCKITFKEFRKDCIIEIL